MKKKEEFMKYYKIFVKIKFPQSSELKKALIIGIFKNIN